MLRGTVQLAHIIAIYSEPYHAVPRLEGNANGVLTENSKPNKLNKHKPQLILFQVVYIPLF